MPRGEISRNDLYLFCERLRQIIEAAEFAFGDTRLQLTVSLGCHQARAGHGTRKLSIDDWIAKADEALYLAKDRGRNRTEYLD